MLQNLWTVVKANKTQIIQKGMIAVGALVGLVVVGLVLNNGNAIEENEEFAPVEESEVVAVG